MFGSRKALLKQKSYTNGRGGFNANDFPPGATPQDVAPAAGDRVQVYSQQSLPDRCVLDTMHVICTHAMQMALLAATRDRETAQVALAEAKTRQDETTEVLATFAVRSTRLALMQLSSYQRIPGGFWNFLVRTWYHTSAGAELVHERASSAAEGEE